MARGDYEEADRGRSQGRRTFVTVLVVLLLLFFAFWYAMSYIRADEEGRRRPGASASTSSVCAIQPKDVVVNVYNGTGRDGLAASVARDLRKRGFQIRKIENYHGGRVGGVGLIRYGDKGAPKVKVVGRHAGAMQKVRDKRVRSIIDVVVGKDFEDLEPLSVARRC
ncbi:LytR C-terminal domain-containing protein [Janibacter melonis]|uniref:LytR C-terminal domain-containing protein n=1 Tax=Janibacter melonis TaxID=262209 RepID=UPI0020965EDD|nr:LytR C-terminal domain-containing protein [Janibacter melonis]